MLLSKMLSHLHFPPTWAFVLLVVKWSAVRAEIREKLDFGNFGPL